MQENESLVNPAEILLEDIHELYHVEPEYEEWDLDKFAAGSYKHCLLQRIYASLAALNMAKDVQIIFNGEFMIEYEIDTKELFSRTALLQKAMPDRRALLYEIRPADWPCFFSRILKHSLKIQEALRFNSGVLIASGLYGCALNYTEAINEEISRVSKEGFELLVYLLNPNQTQFTLDEMNVQFQFPLMDMKKLYWEGF